MMSHDSGVCGWLTFASEHLPCLPGSWPGSCWQTSDGSAKAWLQSESVPWRLLLPSIDGG